MTMKKVLGISFTASILTATVFAATPIICPSASEIKTAQFRFVFPNTRMAAFGLNDQMGDKGVVTVFDVTTQAEAEAYLKKASASYSIYPRSFFGGNYCMYRPGHDAVFPIQSVQHHMISWETVM